MASADRGSGFGDPAAGAGALGVSVEAPVQAATVPAAASRLRMLPILLLAAALTAAAYVWIQSIGGPEAVRQRFGTSGLLVSFLAHWILNLTPLGTVMPLAIANGAIWGFWPGALVSWTGWMAASLTQYLVVRRLGTSLDVDARLAGLPERLRSFPVGHPVFQIAGRSFPWVGLHLVNVSSAVRRVPLRRFVACAALGQAGPALIMAALGAGLLT